MPPPTVVIVPGFGGSVLTSDGCRGNAWLSPVLMSRGAGEWLGVNRTRYRDGRYVSDRRVEPKDFGGTAGVRDLVHPALCGAMGQGYFGAMIDAVEAAGGRAVAAPYDFRTVLNGGGAEYTRRLASLLAANKPAVVVAHSMGAVLARAALSDGRVAGGVSGLVEISPAHGGCVGALEAMIEGGFYVPVSRRDRRLLSAASRENAGLVLTLPNASGFGRGVVWTERGGREHLAGGPWHWPEVDDAWRSLAAPLLASVAGLPTGVAHAVVYSDEHATVVAADGSYGERRDVTAPGDGVCPAESMLCRLCDHSVVRASSASHRVSPGDAVSIDAVLGMIGR